MRTRLYVLIIATEGCLFFANFANAQGSAFIETGVSRIEITPEVPIRLSGYSSRDTCFAGVSQKLWAKALAFGTNQNLSILITVDLLGIPHKITEGVRKKLALQLNLKPAQVAICASSTHSGPQVGNSLSQFYKPLSPDELAEVALYAQELISKLVKVSLASVKDRKPAQISWATGEVDFAVNGRIETSQNGLVDHSLPILQVKSPEGKLRVILVNYACRAATFGPENNTVLGDWVGEAQAQIEFNHPGAVAMVLIGCGGDQNSSPRMNSDNPAKNFEYAEEQGKSIANEVRATLMSSHLWSPISELPVGNHEYINLTFVKIPDPMQLAEDAKSSNGVSNYAHLLLSRMARSENVPMKVSYPVQLWNFGDDFSMVFLAGEVVVDYSIRLKRELGKDRVWINAYSNDMPCYIPSRRVIDKEGSEVLEAMKMYEKPTQLSRDVEEKIINSVYGLLPESFDKREIALGEGSDGVISLSARLGTGIGPSIKYMPEWRAFGWFRSDDRVEWEVTVDNGGLHDVELEWSVSDEDAGKPYILEVQGSELKGEVERTGSWETYNRERIGQIILKAGVQKVVFRPGSTFNANQALLDLRAVRFSPIED